MASQKTPEERAAWGAKMKAAREAKAAERARYTGVPEAIAELDAAVQTEAEENVDSDKSSVPATERVDKDGGNEVKGTDAKTEKTSVDPRDLKIASLEAEIEQMKEWWAAQQSALHQPAPVQIVQVPSDTEKVVMRWQAEVADDNVAVFGANGMWGQVTGKRGTVIVPKNEWSRFYTESIRNLLNNRWLVVLSGMSDDERVLYNCAYKPGEILDEQAFAKLLDMGEKLREIFPNLCTSHQEMIGRRIIEAWQNDTAFNLSRDLIVDLNRMSKKRYENLPKDDLRHKGIFWPVIEAMNEHEATA